MIARSDWVAQFLEFSDVKDTRSCFFTHENYLNLFHAIVNKNTFLIVLCYFD